MMPDRLVGNEGDGSTEREKVVRCLVLNRSGGHHYSRGFFYRARNSVRKYDKNLSH